MYQAESQEYGLCEKYKAPESYYLQLFKNCSGNAATTFALLTPVIIGVVGLAVDYGMAITNKTKLSAAADATALAIAVQSNNDPSATGDKYRAAATSYLKGAYISDAAADLKEIRICSNSGTDCKTDAGVVLAAGEVFIRAESSSMRTLTSIIPVLTGGGSGASSPQSGYSRMMIAAAASALRRTSTKYVDIYLLVDVSASMGLGASPKDQTGMVNNSQIGCAFACHGQGGLHPDTVKIARAAGYTLRIDAVKSALKKVVAQAQSSLTNNGAKIRFAIYTFANDFNEVLLLSSNYGMENDTAKTSIFGAINSLDTMDLNAGTSTPYALNQIKDKIPASGDGKTQTTPETYMFLVTDGTANTTRNTMVTATAESWYVDANWKDFKPDNVLKSDWDKFINNSWANGNSPSINAKLTCPDYQGLQNTVYDANPSPSFINLPVPCVAQPAYPGYASTLTGKAGVPAQDQQFFQPIKKEWCSLVKDKGVNLMTLYTTYYMSPPPAPPYVNYARYSVAPKLEPAMSACATNSNYAFSASDTATIHDSMMKMFALTQGSLRLVR